MICTLRKSSIPTHYIRIRINVLKQHSSNGKFGSTVPHQPQSHSRRAAVQHLLFSPMGDYKLAASLEGHSDDVNSPPVLTLYAAENRPLKAILGPQCSLPPPEFRRLSFPGHQHAHLEASVSLPANLRLHHLLPRSRLYQRPFIPEAYLGIS